MNLLTTIATNQSELEKKLADIEEQIERNKYAYKQAALYYHKILIKLEFYKRYILYPGNKALNTMFNLGSMQGSWLPEADHGEGDYIKIIFKVDGDRLNLLYKCSYEQGDKSLIRIPLILFEQEEELKQFLNAFYREAETTHQNIVTKQKQAKVHQLQEEIKKLNQQ